jgi:hypothetical protein
LDPKFELGIQFPLNLFLSNVIKFFCANENFITYQQITGCLVLAATNAQKADSPFTNYLLIALKKEVWVQYLRENFNFSRIFELHFSYEFLNGK